MHGINPPVCPPLTLKYIDRSIYLETKKQDFGSFVEAAFDYFNHKYEYCRFMEDLLSVYGMVPVRPATVFIQ
jgi:hypothetical protein